MESHACSVAELIIPRPASTYRRRPKARLHELAKYDASQMHGSPAALDAAIGRLEDGTKSSRTAVEK